MNEILDEREKVGATPVRLLLHGGPSGSSTASTGAVGSLARGSLSDGSAVSSDPSPSSDDDDDDDDGAGAGGGGPWGGCEVTPAAEVDTEVVMPVDVVTSHAERQPIILA